jgi:hypothetical protein
MEPVIEPELTPWQKCRSTASSRKAGPPLWWPCRACRRQDGTAGRNLRPIRPGMSGGQYSPLTDANVLRIHEAALDALETIGLSQAPPSGVEIMTGPGPSSAMTGGSGFRVRWSRTCWHWRQEGSSCCLAATRNSISTCREPGAFRHRRCGGACGRCRRTGATANPPRRIFMTRRGSPMRSTMCISSSAPWSAATSSTISRWTQHALCLLWRHHEACRHQLLGPVAFRRLSGSSSHDRRRTRPRGGRARSSPIPTVSWFRR